MANPTSNFGWQMPTPVDLVTDLPADFEVFGQAVDSSLADLKGGTSGQVLSKNSNTDMDFVWIANDQGDITAVTAGTGISGGGTSGAVTVTNSMATAIDAKGDLIAGTGADAFARLAVGANDLLLTAASGEATGLTYTGAWTTYTPSYLLGITQGNGTVTARYRKLGKVVDIYFKFTLGSTSALGAPGFAGFALPINNVTEVFGGGAVCLDSGVANLPAYYQITNNEVYFKTINGANLDTTVPFTWGTSDSVTLFGSYEVA